MARVDFQAGDVGGVTGDGDPVICSVDVEVYTAWLETPLLLYDFNPVTA